MLNDALNQLSLRRLEDHIFRTIGYVVGNHQPFNEDSA
jgi:hypothetical protein